MLRIALAFALALSAVAAERPTFSIDKSQPYDATKVRPYNGRSSRREAFVISVPLW